MDMLHDLSSAIAKALAEGKTPTEAASIGEILVRREYAGERIYIARMPRAQHAYDMGTLGTAAATTRQAAQALGVSERQVRRVGRMTIVRSSK